MLTRRRLSLAAGTALAARAARAANPPADLAAEFARIEAGVNGRMGVSIRDTGSGRRWAHRADERFPMCSTFKLLACGAVLSRVDAGQEDLNRRIRFTPADLVTYSPVTEGRVGGEGMTLAELCEAAMTRSDNAAGNLLLASLGGPAAVTALARRIGDGSTRLDRIEATLNEAAPGDPRDTTTPDAMAGNLQALALGDVLSRPSRDRLLGWMVDNRTGGAKLRAGLPEGWRVGDKTGGGDFGTTNDIAVLWPEGRAPVVACVYLTETESPFDDRNAAIAAVARALHAALGA